MSTILHLETATKVCSVALSKDGVLVAYKETAVANSHSSIITTYAEEVLKMANVTFADLSAICVSMGPGSYTGLRIGVSTGKGFCYALNIPLIAVNTLHAMANHYISEKTPPEGTLLCSMIDARRMEVFTALFDNHALPIQKTSAEIIDEHAFSAQLATNNMIFFGDGAAKCKESLSHQSKAIFDDDFEVSARGMVSIAWEKFQQQQFEDVAYFEPFYLKDFMATQPKKMI